MMNYCDKTKYRVFSVQQAAFQQMVNQLLQQIPRQESVLRLVFFGAPKTNDEYISQHTILRERMQAYFGDKIPAFSYVSQSPLNAAIVVEVHSFTPDKEDRLFYKKHETCPYVVLENKEGRFLYAGGCQSDSIDKTIEIQSRETFRLIGGLLEREGFPINRIIRQWNYIEQITRIREANQNYQSFNNARSDFYGKTLWVNGYPAATGIGTDTGGVLVDFNAAVFTSLETFTTPIDNDLQIAAHAYSEKVLKKAQAQKATPKFERARSVTFSGRRIVHISGTAAIRGEESLKDTGIEKQLHITMENIARLIGGAVLQMLRVYLKNKADLQVVKKLMDNYNLSIPISYLRADICREELLVEIEGIAID